MSVVLLTQRVLDGVPLWVLQGASLDFDFAHRRYFQQGHPSNIEALLTTSRASVGYVDYVNGIWRPITANLLRVSDKGLLIEEARTNDALYCRDMTNAAWVKVNMTAALTITGIDGIANSASMLTATVGNATILQTITLGSQADTYSVWLKRISGSGEVDITVDNGVTWTSETITSTYQRFQVQKTAANPIFGIRIVNSGDVVAADFNQLEPGGFATSPILTTSATATRATDVVTVKTVPVFGSAYTLFGKGTPNAPTSYATNQTLWRVDDNTAFQLAVLFKAGTTGFASANSVNTGGTGNSTFLTGTLWSQGVSGKLIAAVANGDQAGSFNGGAVGTTSGNFPLGPNSTHIGSNATGMALFNGYIERIALWPTTRLPNATLQQLTSP